MSLSYEEALRAYTMIKEKASEIPEDDTDLKEFYQDFLRSAMDYALIRTQWTFMSLDEIKEIDPLRTRRHNGFIAALEGICRNFRIEGIDAVMLDRKTKGDFACYISMFLGIEQR
ncbi:MAG: hypothetical protein IKJ69_03080 [Clostridia bacterium]|nr:hypothetical protein [Clostridia bacterium]